MNKSQYQQLVNKRNKDKRGGQREHDKVVSVFWFDHLL